jgi:hypothetical protein
LTRFYQEETFVSGVLLMALLLVLNISHVDIGFTNSLMLAAAGLLCMLYIIGGRIGAWRKAKAKE